MLSCYTKNHGAYFVDGGGITIGSGCVIAAGIPAVMKSKVEQEGVPC